VGRRAKNLEDVPPKTAQTAEQHSVTFTRTPATTAWEFSYSQQGEVGMCRVLGVYLAGQEGHGAAAVDKACVAALEMGVHEYHFVRRYLDRCPQAPLSLRQVDPLIRELYGRVLR
jgi:hypothetical protein